MEGFKNFLKRVFCLPPLPTVLIAVPSFTFVFVMLSVGGHSGWTYLSYALSTYALVLTVTGTTRIIRAAKKGFQEMRLTRWICRIPFGKRYLEDPVFRAEAALYGGLFLNFAYVFIKLFSGIYYRSLWFITLSVYYIFLTVLRFVLLHHVRNNPVGQEYRSELKRYRLCGFLLLTLNLALSGIITLVVMQNQGFTYAGYLIYVMAAYAFYAVISSVVNLVKFRKYNSPVISAAKVVSLTAALVSMLSLETAMIAQFGGTDTHSFRRWMTAGTGFIICTVVQGMAIYMIATASRKMKQMN